MMAIQVFFSVSRMLPPSSSSASRATAASRPPKPALSIKVGRTGVDLIVFVFNFCCHNDYEVKKGFLDPTELNKVNRVLLKLQKFNLIGNKIFQNFNVFLLRN